MAGEIPTPQPEENGLHELVGDLKAEEEYLRDQIKGVTSLEDLTSKLGDLTPEEQELLSSFEDSEGPFEPLDPEISERIKAKTLEKIRAERENLQK